jgi:hypothetical protein
MVVDFGQAPGTDEIQGYEAHRNIDHSSSLRSWIMPAVSMHTAAKVIDQDEGSAGIDNQGLHYSRTYRHEQ